MISLLISIAALFFLGIVFISYQQLAISLFIFLGLLVLLFFNKEKRFIISTLLSVLIGYVLFIVSSNFVSTMDVSKEIKIIINRLFLVFIIIGIVINHRFFKREIYWYNEKPDWKNSIVLPFHKINIFAFWLIGIVINVVIYAFIIFQKDIGNIQALLLFCLFFSLINAVFEEVIWRGLLLSTLKKYTSVGYAVVVTSVGFGLFHLSIGFSIYLSLLISVAGLIYALITLKTNSLYPSIIFHIIINIGMVFSGLIN